MLLAGHDTGRVCHCQRRHGPQPRHLHRHHVIPLKWRGPDTPENQVWICPTTHANVHLLLDAWMAYDGKPPWLMRRGFGRFTRDLAEEGYRGWVNMGRPRRLED